MKLNRLNTVKIKLTIAILLLTLVIVSFVGLYFPGRFKYEQLVALEDKAKTTTSIIGSNISGTVFFNDADVLKEDLSKILNYEDFGFIVVESNGKNLYEYNYPEAEENNYKISSTVSSADENSFFKVKERISLQGKEVGTLYIGFKLTRIYAQFEQIKQKLIIINFLLLSFGVVSALLIGIYFTDPIKNLIEVADKVESGNFQSRVNIKNKDEIGYLAFRFNKMIHTLGEFYSDLENKVAQRTKELGETNQKLGHEIEERKNAELKLVQSLDEKVILLKEIHHRVKNNLQIISSMLYLQSLQTEDTIIKQYFEESRNRIVSMALVHENLYRNDNLNRIDFSKYVNDLLHNLSGSFSDYGDVGIKTELEQVFLPIDKAIPLGLILNEIITNSFKHAFDKNVQTEKTLWVRIKNGQYVSIEVEDNGKGLPENFSMENHDSLGMKILSSLTVQIDAELQFKNNTGALFTIILNK